MIQGKSPQNFSRILVPTDFSDCSLEALDYAVLMANTFKSEMTLLHVIELKFSTVPERVAKMFAPSVKDATERLNALANQVARRGAKTQMLCRRGLPKKEILKTEKDIAADLIVMGTHGRAGMTHMMIGSVAEHVVRSASCPVLTIRWTETSDDTLEGIPVLGHPFILPQFSG